MSIFSQKALELVPRALGFMDRDPASATFGCCDRNFWHYRLTDVSNARFQEAGLLLALASTIPAPNNPFLGNTNVARWSRAAWHFWLKRRNRDGSVVEVYPFERSFCATAFGAAAFVETVRLLGGPGAWQAELELARPTFEWLARPGRARAETANQMAASLLGLCGYAALTGDARWAQAVLERREAVLRMADADGGFAEYGGVDAGYQSITMSLLTRVNDWCGGDAAIRDVLTKGEKILAARVDLFGRVASELNSRNTQFVYPFGLSALGSRVAASLEQGLGQDQVLSPQWMDDRYCVPLASDYLMASREFVR